MGRKNKEMIESSIDKYDYEKFVFSLWIALQINWALDELKIIVFDVVLMIGF